VVRHWPGGVPRVPGCGPANFVQREPERREAGEQPAQRRKQHLIDPGRRQERVQHRDVRGDPVPGSLVKPGTMLPDRRLGSGHGQQ
jgi:hypothetical protein